MRLANGLFIEKEATFGSLRFSALRREVHEQDEDGMPTNVIKERTYDLKSETQGRMIQVSIPASVPLRDYEYNAEVDMVNPVVNTVAHATFGNNADVEWYIKAEDIVLVKPEPASVPSSGQPAQPRRNNQMDKKA
nr:YdcP family protein [uncultured Agathobaculum sp.]